MCSLWSACSLPQKKGSGAHYLLHRRRLLLFLSVCLDGEWMCVLWLLFYTACSSSFASARWNSLWSDRSLLFFTKLKKSALWGSSCGRGCANNDGPKFCNSACTHSAHSGQNNISTWLNFAAANAGKTFDWTTARQKCDRLLADSGRNNFSAQWNRRSQKRICRVNALAPHALTQKCWLGNLRDQYVRRACLLLYSNVQNTCRAEPPANF